jgi:hypothetical protein
MNGARPIDRHQLIPYCPSDVDSALKDASTTGGDFHRSSPCSARPFYSSYKREETPLSPGEIPPQIKVVPESAIYPNVGRFLEIYNRTQS